MSEGRVAPGITRPRADAILPLVLIATIGVMLAIRTGLFAADLMAMLRWPFELDYGEGIVWEQADLIAAGHGFGDISDYPFVVFHYPPVYHLLVEAAARLSGGDPLFVGRLISILSLGLALMGVGWLASRVDHPHERSRAVVCAGTAALFATVFPPVLLWTGLMRVDLTALAFTVAGLVAGIAAFQRPRLVHIAYMFFVLAVFTKQTAIAAPAALTLVLLVHNPKAALAGVISGLVVGLFVLSMLVLNTDGNVIRHLFLYNVNRFDFLRLLGMLLAGLGPCLPLIAVVVALTMSHSQVKNLRISLCNLHDLRVQMNCSYVTRIFSIVLLWLTLSSILSLTVAKSGSNLNYFLEPVAAVLVLLGIGLRQPHKASDRRLIGVALLATLIIAPWPFYRPAIAQMPSESQQWQFADELSHADAPVLSDDMVILKRAGHAVFLEPAIFAELTSTGLWNEKPLLKMLYERGFALIATMGGESGHLYKARYSPAARRAIAANYPVKRSFGDLVLHLPANGRVPSPAPAAPAASAAAR